MSYVLYMEMMVHYFWELIDRKTVSNFPSVWRTTLSKKKEIVLYFLTENESTESIGVNTGARIKSKE